MFEERKAYFIIYPEYFDSRLSQRLGRKVPLELAIENPTLEELYEAVKSLKLTAFIEKEKSRPSNWFERKGRIKVLRPQGIKKRQLLKLIAKRLAVVREKIKKEKKEKKKKARTSVDKYIQRILTQK